MARNRRSRRPITPPDWKFNSFPTYFAFALGFLIATVLVAVGFYLDLLLIPSVFFVSYGIIHISTTTVLRARQRRADARVEEEERERRIYAARAAAAAEAPAPRKRRRRR